MISEAGVGEMLSLESIKDTEWGPFLEQEG